MPLSWAAGAGLAVGALGALDNAIEKRQQKKDREKRDREERRRNGGDTDAEILSSWDLVHRAVPDVIPLPPIRDEREWCVILLPRERSAPKGLSVG